jgi:mono/diheme cytochrome c family protein
VGGVTSEGVAATTMTPVRRSNQVWVGRSRRWSPRCRRTVLILLSLWLPVTLLTACGCRRPGSTSGARPSETVERVYELHCVGCHGARGEWAWGSNIQDLKSSLEEIATVIADGAGKMPGFKGHLTGAEVRELAAYVKAFRRAGQRAPGGR